MNNTKNITKRIISRQKTMLGVISNAIKRNMKLGVAVLGLMGLPMFSSEALNNQCTISNKDQSGTFYVETIDKAKPLIDLAKTDMKDIPANLLAPVSHASNEVIVTKKSPKIASTVDKSLISPAHDNLDNSVNNLTKDILTNLAKSTMDTNFIPVSSTSNQAIETNKLPKISSILDKTNYENYRQAIDKLCFEMNDKALNKYMFRPMVVELFDKLQYMVNNISKVDSTAVAKLKEIYQSMNIVKEELREDKILLKEQSMNIVKEEPKGDKILLKMPARMQKEMIRTMLILKYMKKYYCNNNNNLNCELDKWEDQTSKNADLLVLLYDYKKTIRNYPGIQGRELNTARSHAVHLGNKRNKLNRSNLNKLEALDWFFLEKHRKYDKKRYDDFLANDRTYYEQGYKYEQFDKINEMEEKYREDEQATLEKEMLGCDKSIELSYYLHDTLLNYETILDSPRNVQDLFIDNIIYSMTTVQTVQNAIYNWVNQDKSQKVLDLVMLTVSKKLRKFQKDDRDAISVMFDNVQNNKKVISENITKV